MTSYPEDCRYSKEHEWVRPEEQEAAVGITDFAQAELGDVVFVELPEKGESFAAGDEIGTIESVKAVAEIYTPVSGRILDVNGSLVDEPELVNQDPHGRGWLVRVEMTDAAELGELMKADEYSRFIAEGD